MQAKRVGNRSLLWQAAGKTHALYEGTTLQAAENCQLGRSGL
jgi:hypothetical protein